LQLLTLTQFRHSYTLQYPLHLIEGSLRSPRYSPGEARSSLSKGRTTSKWPPPQTGIMAQTDPGRTSHARTGRSPWTGS